MNDKIKQIATEVGISVEYLTNTKQWVLIEAFAERIVQNSLVDFYSNYLDLNSSEDITVQVNRYVEDHYKVSTRAL